MTRRRALLASSRMLWNWWLQLCPGNRQPLRRLQQRVPRQAAVAAPSPGPWSRPRGCSAARAARQSRSATCGCCACLRASQARPLTCLRSSSKSAPKRPRPCSQRRRSVAWRRRVCARVHRERRSTRGSARCAAARSSVCASQTASCSRVHLACASPCPRSTRWCREHSVSHGVNSLSLALRAQSSVVRAYASRISRRLSRTQA
mmetsp:Transcript_18059/g.48582  ORF Transcript_18059/g.48582 Transcript_18059/m.48582 type:complete len:204 (-) Transcript_18059:357-968(-)